jgi:hypothetical protein
MKSMKQNYKILIFILGLLTGPNLFSQTKETKNSYNFVNTDLKSALEEIAKDYRLQLIYSDSKVDLSKTINKQFVDGTLKEILDGLLDKTSIAYHIKGNQLILIEKKETAFFSISGTITDRQTGEFLIGASVYDRTDYHGTVSNNYGYYSYKTQQGKSKITYSFVGYQPIEIEVSLVSDTAISIGLTPMVEIQEVVVTDNSPIRAVQNAQMSTVRLPMKEVSTLPVLLGEVDIIKSLQLMPGVQGGMEGTSGLYVRGGGLEQNLILLDGVPVYNVNHLFGLFSVFNSDAINNVTMIKGGFPARYGGRLSSVVDIRMKEGNKNKLKGNVSVGLLSSKLTLEGPIGSPKTSFIVSARRSYFDVLTYPIQKIVNKNKNYKALVQYNLQDINAKINHQFSDKSRLYLSAYTGGDNFYNKSEDSDLLYKDNVEIKWGNITSALRWNYLWGKGLFGNLTLTYSDYKFKFFLSKDEFYIENDEIVTESEAISTHSEIEDLGIKYDLDYNMIPNHYIRIGISNTWHRFTPGINAKKENHIDFVEVDTTYGRSNIPAKEFYTYLEDEFRIGSKVKLNAGIHYSNFYINSVTYHSFEPRVSGRVIINDHLSFKASYVEMTQYLHLLANSSLGLPTDLWVPCTDKVKPQKAKQYASGLAVSLKDEYEISVEGFYKTMKNLIEYHEGTDFFNFKDNWEDEITTGDGESYGIEMFVRKSAGKTTGWLGYTLSWSNRTFPKIGFGKTFPYSFDRRHDIALVITHKFNDRINIGANWVFGSGYPITIPDQKFTNMYYLRSPFYKYPNIGQTPPSKTIKSIKNRNSYRKPAYHRLDAGINLVKEKKRGTRTWSFGVYNMYARQNPFMIYPSEKFNPETGEYDIPVLKQVSFLQCIPYFRWGFQF